MTNSNSPSSPSTPRPGIDYGLMSFLMLTPVIGIGGTALYTWLRGFELWMPLLALGMYLSVGLSICAGYHRFFSHKSYEASRPVQLFYAVFGAMAAQNSILWWSSAHRTHHQYVDRDWDPYSIKRGFWWAHILWIFHKHDAPDVEGNASDLLANPIVRWQDRWYKVLVIAVGFGLPTLIGALFGDAAEIQRRGVGARQLGRGAAHARRGLPQLPPSLSRRLPQRDPLVRLGSGEVVHRRSARGRPGPRAAGHAHASRGAGEDGGGRAGRRAASRRGSRVRGRRDSPASDQRENASRHRGRALAAPSRRAFLRRVQRLEEDAAQRATPPPALPPAVDRGL